MSHLPENLPHIIQIAEPFVKNYGYLGMGIVLLLENFFLPLPGETTLIAASVFAGIGELNIYTVIVIGLVCAVVGASLAYFVGKFAGKFIVEKYGKYFFLTPKRYKKIEDYYNKRGGKIVITARFIDGLRQLNGLLAGTNEMRWNRFMVCNFIGALLWVLVFACAGYFGGGHIQILLKYQIYVTVAAAIGIIGVLVFKHYKKNYHPKI